VEIIGEEEQDRAKLEYANNPGLSKVTAIGNGRNDYLLLKEAAFGICDIQKEGAAVNTMNAAEMLCVHVNDT
jgi:soluble P-type ATPase